MISGPQACGISGTARIILSILRTYIEPKGKPPYFLGFGWPLHLFYQSSSSWRRILGAQFERGIWWQLIQYWYALPVWAASISESIGSPIIFRLTQNITQIIPLNQGPWNVPVSVENGSPLPLVNKTVTGFAMTWSPRKLIWEGDFAVGHCNF